MNSDKRESKIQNPKFKIHVGCQGWNYADWTTKAGGEKIFYPRGTKSVEMLAVYAEVFETVEVDSTFYAIPPSATIENWRRKTPEKFTFSLKMPQEITHEYNLREPSFPILEEFCERVKDLKEKLGVVLVHSLHGLVLSVWIAAAAFAALDRSLEEAARNIGAGPLRTFLTVSLPLAAPGIMAAAVFVFLESLDEFTGTYFVGVPDVITLPLLMFNASMGGNYQIAAITALILLVPSIVFMLVIERFLKADVVGRIGG